MRAKGIPVQQIILGLALLAGLCWNLAHASEINDLRVSAGATGTRAEIGLDSQVEYKILTLSNPERLVVDLPGVDPVRGLELPAAAGLVKDVRTGQPVPGTTRIVFDRSEEHTSELQSLMRISYAVFCLKKKIIKKIEENTHKIQN